MLKKLASIALAALLILTLTAVPALAQEAPQAQASPANTITVHGTANVDLKADYASINLGVSTKSTTVSKAQAANSKTMDKVIKAIKDQGVAAADIATSSFNVYANYDYQNSTLTNNNSLSGYTVENMLTVTVRNMDNVSAVLDAAMAAGANQSYGVTFGSSKQDEAYDEALKEAVKDGADKAALLTATTGKALGALLSIEENEYSYGLYGSSMKSAQADTAAGTPILAGQITVSATVTLVYEMK